MSTATPYGLLNLATVPTPSADPAVVVNPAMVVTVPAQQQQVQRPLQAPRQPIKLHRTAG